MYKLFIYSPSWVFLGVPESETCLDTGIGVWPPKCMKKLKQLNVITLDKYPYSTLTLESKRYRPKKYLHDPIPLRASSADSRSSVSWLSISPSPTSMAEIKLLAPEYRKKRGELKTYILICIKYSGKWVKNKDYVLYDSNQISNFQDFFSWLSLFLVLAL